MFAPNALALVLVAGRASPPCPVHAEQPLLPRRIPKGRVNQSDDSKAAMVLLSRQTTANSSLSEPFNHHQGASCSARRCLDNDRQAWAAVATANTTSHCHHASQDA